jgi:hypothetical protein
MQKFENNVVNDVATRRKYVTPEIEVIPLNVEGALLSASATGTAGGSANAGEFDDEEW